MLTSDLWQSQPRGESINRFFMAWGQTIGKGMIFQQWGLPEMAELPGKASELTITRSMQTEAGSCG